MGLGVVWLTYLLAKRISDTLAALNPLLFEDSLFARPESFVTLLTLIAAWLMTRDQHPKSEIAGVSAVSFVVGLLIATKISMLALLPLPFLPLKTVGSCRLWRFLPVRGWARAAAAIAPRRHRGAEPDPSIGLRRSCRR